MKMERKQVSITLPYQVAKRLSFLRQAGAAEPINEAMNAFVESQIAEIEKKLRIPPDAWKQHRVCTKCDGIMVLRTSTKQDGKSFWGCLSYPQCTHTMSVTTTLPK